MAEGINPGGFAKEDLAQAVVNTLMQGGTHAVLLAMLLVIGALLYERQRLLREIERLHKRLDDVIERYHAGQLTVSETIITLRNMIRSIWRD